MTSVIKHYLLLFIKGLAMGAADVVPGVSGGTIAFITGIYQELIDAIKSVGPNTVVILFREGPLACWRSFNGTFLLVLLSGIAVSVLSLARLISDLLVTHPVLIWSFFFGLIVASIVHMAKQIRQWRVQDLLGLLGGAAFVLFLSSTALTVQSPSMWMVFFSGAIAICAMILPGISGSFILLLMGMYQSIIGAIKDLDLMVIATFGSGAALGLLGFSRFLSWLLHRYYQLTLSVLTGFLIGSLYVVWPWKQVLTTAVRHGETVAVLQKPVTPAIYTELYQQDSQWLMALMAMCVGCALVLGLEVLADRFTPAKEDGVDG